MHDTADSTLVTISGVSTRHQQGDSSADTMLRSAIWFVAVPLLLLLVVTLTIRMTNLDVVISGLFYDRAAGQWTWMDAEPWMTLYHYGPLPGLVMGVGGAVIALLSLVWSRIRPWREMGLFLALLLALGPGLAINGILKPVWMRPRPSQIAAFGGSFQFIPAWGVGSSESSKSFPSGHASMGFFLMGPAFLLYRRRREWAIRFLVLGLIWGSVMGVARIVQGQHFFSDVIWSAGMVYLTGAVLSYLLRLTNDTRSPSEDETADAVILPIENRIDAGIASPDDGDVRRRDAA